MIKELNMKVKELMHIMSCNITLVNLTNPENEDIHLTFWDDNESFLVPITYDEFSPLYDYIVTEITKNSNNEVVVFIKNI